VLFVWLLLVYISMFWILSYVEESIIILLRSRYVSVIYS